MSSPTRVPSIVFTNTLHDNPSAQWPKFYREAKQFAYRFMQEYPGYPGGLLFFVLPIAEYNAVPHVTVGGVPIPPAIPLYPADLTAAATASEIATYRTNVDLCTHFFRIKEAFKTAILIAMGESLVLAIANPLAGYAVTMDISEIFEHLRATYGILTTGDIRALQTDLQVPILSDDMATFVSFAARFSEVIERLETAGQGLRPFQQMESFINSTSNQFNISKAIEKYVETNPILANRSLPQMIAYVRTHLSNVIPTSAASGYSGSAKNMDRQVISEVFDKIFSDKIAEIEARLAAAASQTPLFGTVRQQLPKAYCYVHGTCAHPAVECQTMLADRAKYSNRMLKAKTSTEVHGGSTKG